MRIREADAVEGVEPQPDVFPIPGSTGVFRAVDMEDDIAMGGPMLEGADRSKCLDTDRCG